LIEKATPSDMTNRAMQRNRYLLKYSVFIYNFIPSSYYIVVVFIDPLQGLLYYKFIVFLLYLFNRFDYDIQDAVDWCTPPTALTVYERLQPQSLCPFVNQLDTA
jgi:hypothetical protein